MIHFMHEQVREQEYRTWRGYVADFELICSNAMTYNQKRSRVHKSAVTMLRVGKKQLQASELTGRKVDALAAVASCNSSPRGLGPSACVALCLQHPLC